MNPGNHSDFEIIRGNLTQIEQMIGHELNLIGVRLTWFAISQSFLFGAYATILNARAFSAWAEISTSQSILKQMPIAAVTATIMFLGVPVVGWLFASAAFRSVNAASDVLETLDPVRGEYLIRLNSLLGDRFPPLPVVGSEQHRKELNPAYPRLADTIARGRVPQRLLPRVMGWIWGIIFVTNVILLTLKGFAG